MTKRKKKTSPSIDERIEHEVVMWGRALALHAWTFSHSLINEDELGCDYGLQSAAELHSFHPYLRAKINFNKTFIIEADDELLSRTILHEMVHVLQMPVYQVIADVAGADGGLTDKYKIAAEAVTDHISAVMWDLRDWKGLTRG